jgi:hypothetical protein
LRRRAELELQRAELEGQRRGSNGQRRRIRGRGPPASPCQLKVPKWGPERDGGVRGTKFDPKRSKLFPVLVRSFV